MYEVVVKNMGSSNTRIRNINGFKGELSAINDRLNSAIGGYKARVEGEFIRFKNINLKESDFKTDNCMVLETSNSDKCIYVRKFQDNLRFKDFCGYTIFENGVVIGLRGEILKARLKDGYYDIAFKINGVTKRFILARLLYSLFIEEFDLTDANNCITYKDKNGENISLDNLELVRKNNLRLTNGKKLTNEQITEIKNSYGKKTNQFDTNRGLSYKELADKYGLKVANVKYIVRKKELH